jgi:hypothetical protein
VKWVLEEKDEEDGDWRALHANEVPARREGLICVSSTIPMLAANDFSVSISTSRQRTFP